ISLSIADLLCSLLIVPFSLYSSVRPNWAFAGDNSLICKYTVYLHLVLITSTLFTFSWISPSRYEAVHTLTRCKCWILFSWITALLLACPVLITKMEANYSSHLELCLLNWSSSTLAYSLTLGILVCLPSLCTVAFTGCAIFTAMQKPDELEDIQRSILETDQNFVITLFILISFVLSWLPLIIFQFLPSQLFDNNDAGVMKFAFTWLAIGGGSSKLLIYSFTSKQFRHSLCCCKGFFFVSREQLPPPSLMPTKTIEERLLDRDANSISNNLTTQQQQQQHPNINSPIINAYSFLASFDYGSFGLGPNGGFLTDQQQKQNTSYFNRQRNY
uniref:G-protein coupled receptors family 1 profile domain-containing protein n=1 Tax=Meloidogyne incognita TaxID=6306 RepID=A0A914MWI9_MELIC